MPKLKVVEFQTVSYCNSDCLVCPWSKLKKNTVLQYMDEKTWKSLIDGLKEMQPERVIPYLNNEPLLDKDIFEKIEVLKQIVPSCTMELSTNGLLMNKDISEKLLHSPIDDILISVFGHDAESQTRIMGPNIPYKQVVENVLYLRKILNQTKSHKNLAVVKIVNSPYVNQSDVEKNKQFWLKHGVEVREYGYLDRAKNIGQSSQRDNKIKPNGCELKRDQERMYVYCDGTAYLCCHDWSRRFPMGNINQTSMKNIWQGQYYKKIRKMVNGKIDSDESFLCRNCKLCMGI